MNHLAQIQFPALVALVALVLEGVATMSPLAGLFQLVPIFASFGAVYFAWSGGYYFVAVLYVLGGLLAFGAFFSVRLIANIPGIVLYLLILFLPRVHEGPEGDLFATIQIPPMLALATVAMGLVVALLGIRFKRPTLFLATLVGFAGLLSATCSEMLSQFGWLFLQRGVSFGIGLVTMLIGYWYYRSALAWRYLPTSQDAEDGRSVPVDPRLQEELQKFVLELDHFRTQQGFRLGWVEAATIEAGIDFIFEELVRSGGIMKEYKGSMTSQLGPKAPVKSDGLTSDPAELLAVSRSANTEQMKESYQRIAAFFHHERINQMSPEAQAVARKMAAAFSKAYRVLSKT